MAMDPLRQIVLALATMSEHELRDMRVRVQMADGPSNAKELVITLIDLYLAAGSSPDKRAEAAAMCLVALDRIEGGGGGGGYRPSYGSSSAKKGGCGSAAVIFFGLVGLVWALL